MATAAQAQNMEIKDTASGECWGVSALSAAGVVPQLAPCDGSANQNLTFDSASGNIWESGIAWGYCLREDTLTIDVCWTGYPEKWVMVNGYVQAENGNALLPDANGNASLGSPAGPWVFDQQAAAPPPPPPPPPAGLGAVPIGIFSPLNPNATDQFKESGSWEYWGETLLGRATPVITEPLATGINPNYGGDAFGWTDPASIMVQDTNPTWMLQVGLSSPGGPTLTAAATGAMDQDWGNAAGSARFGASYGHSTGANLWDPTGMKQARKVLYARFGWEETGDWNVWGMNAPGQVSTWAADFKAAFDRAATIFRNECAIPDQDGNTCTVIVVFNPNGDYASKGINLDDHAPTNWDIAAVDVYDQPKWQGGYQSDGVTPALDPLTRFNQFILPNLQAIDAYAKAHSKKVGICEMGAGDSGDNPVFIQQIAAWAASAQSPVGIIGYQNEHRADAGLDTDLEMFPEEKDAFIKAFKAN
jgi:hypothetical protein